MKLASSLKRTLSQAIHHSPSADNSQPWKMEWHDNILIVHYDTKRVFEKTFACNSHATLLAIGAATENLTQAANALGLTLYWELPEVIDLKTQFYFQVTVNSGCDSFNLSQTKHLQLFKRHTNRHPYKAQLLPDDVKAQLIVLTQGSARLVVITNKAAIANVSELVRRASELRFQTQEAHELLGKSLRFDSHSDSQHGEGLDVATLALPPGGALFLRLISDWSRMRWFNAFGTYKLLAMIDAHPVRTASALLAIVGPSTSILDTISAGQLMNRAWISLNAQDICVHPYYAVSDQIERRKLGSIPRKLIEHADHLHEEARHQFLLGDGETLHMLLRVGYSARKPVLSKRVPLEMVCSGINLNDE